MSLKYRQVLFITNSTNSNDINKAGLLKAFPNQSPVWKDFEFEIVESIKGRKKNHYDFVVYYWDRHLGGLKNPYQAFTDVDDLNNIDYKKALFFPCECSTVVDYKSVYSNLFKIHPYNEFEVCCIVDDFPSKNVQHIDFIPLNTFCYHHSYDFFKNHSPKKEKSLVIISSNATYAKMHKDRIDFSHKIKEYFGEEIDFYGRGFKDFSDKYETIAPYKYHIVMENGSEKNYWTEKLRDAYFAECYPIYFGCPNIHDYFSKNAVTSFDIKDFDGAVKIIKKVLKNNLYEKNYSHIVKAKNLITSGEYNMFDLIRKSCLEAEKK